MLVFGIDTGSVKCGYAVLIVDGDAEPVLAECGVIRAPVPANDNGGKWTRMRIIGTDVDDLLGQYGAEPTDVFGIEDAFIPRHAHIGVQTLAEARGTVAYVASKRGLTVVTVSPATVKKVVTGSGKADKAQVAEMVRLRFKLRTAPPPDASDAVGVALAVALGGKR